MEKKKINIGVYASIFIFVFALIFFFLSFDLAYTGRFGPGPGFFPRWLSILLLIASVLYFIESVRGNNTSNESMPVGKDLKRIAFIIGTLILFIVLLPLLGFTLTGIIFLFILLYKSYKWYINLGASILISVIMFILFYKLLGVAFPVNSFGW